MFSGSASRINKMATQEMITDWMFWSSSNSFDLLSDLNHQIIFLYQNGNFGFGELLVVDELCEGMAVTTKSQQFHGVVSRTLELFPNKEILNTVLVPSLRPMAADLNTNFRFVCELKNLIKPYTKVGLYQNTVSEDICSWCRSNLLHAPVPSLGFVKHNTKSYIWALHLLR